MSSKANLTCMILAGVAVCLIWAAVLDQAEDSVFARVPYLDEINYLDRAAEIRAGQWQSPRPYVMSPLYPWFLVLVGGGDQPDEGFVYPAASLRGVRILHIACWCGIVLLLRLLAGRHLGPLVSSERWRSLLVWTPALLFALYRPAAIFSLSILLELPLTLLLTLALWLASRDDRAARLADFFFLGLILGSAALLRGTVLLLLPVLLWWRLGGRRGWGPAAVAVGLAAVGLLLVVGPGIVHNSRLAGRPAGPFLNGGMNLYIGNGPDANGFFVGATTGDWRRDPAGTDHLATRLGVPAVSTAEADRIWTDLAWQEIRRDPGRALGLWLKKFWLFLQGAEVDQLAPQAGWIRSVPLLRLFIIPFGLISTLGLTGLILLWRRNPQVRLWSALLILLVAGQSVFFMVSRYRLVILPLLCLLAGAGLTRLRPAPKKFWLVLAAVFVLVLPWGLQSVRDMIADQALANEGRRWLAVAETEQPGDALARAEDLYLRSLATDPDYAAPYMGMVAVLEAAHRNEQAEIWLRKGIANVKSDRNLRKALISILLQKGRHQEALQELNACLAGWPADADCLHNLAVLLAGSGQQNGAQAAARQLLASHPDDPRGYVDLGVLLAREGKGEQARMIFEQGLERLPDHPDLLENLSRVAE